jgi:membrane-bound lytic murein transglycosylase D
MLRMVTPPDEPFDLHLPAGTATLFEQRIANIPEAKRTAWRYHRVAADDSLASVAHQFHVSESELAEVNQLRATGSLQGVEGLAIPVAPVAAGSTHMMLYTARRGDTLVTIADRFGVSLTQLRAWNKMTGVKVDPGRRLHIAEPAGASHAATSHRAQSSAPREKASPAASAKGSAHKRTTPSSSKRAAPSGASKSTQKPHNPATASKSGTLAAKKHASKPAARAKSSTP